MKSIEIKIFGQTFLIKPPEGKQQFYEDVAHNLDKMMNDEAIKADIRSDIRAVIKVAFVLAAENNELKAELNKSLEVLKRIDNNINSFGV